MRRLIFLMLAAVSLAAVVSNALPARLAGMVGPGIGYVAADTAAGNPWNAYSGGLFVNGYMYWEESFFVMYGAAMIGSVLGSNDNSVAIDLEMYGTPFTDYLIDFDMLYGFGYRLPLGKPWMAVLAAGFYMGGTYLAPKTPSLPEYGCGGYGPGLGACLLYSVASNLGIEASVNLGYSLSISGNEYLMGSTAGLHVFGGVGISF